MISAPTLRLLFSLLLLGFLFSCRAPIQSHSSSIVSFFKPSSVPDTLHIEISNELSGATDTLPNALFFSQMPKALMQPIDYLVDSVQGLVLARKQIPVDAQFTLYCIEFQQFWFQNHSLFVYDKQRKTFNERITVAEWYGGESGQILTGSWLFDFDGDGKKDIVRREIQHSMVLQNDESVESTQDTAQLFLWHRSQFLESPQDPKKLAPFRIKSFWE